ncbi:hypothetical protein AAKU58_004385 [Oxalobacteraceae bacterium GrIS 1.18]
MRGYAMLCRSNSLCVRFVRNSEIEDQYLNFLASELESSAMTCAYVNYSDVDEKKEGLIRSIAGKLQLQNYPYGSNALASFWDDLITLSSQSNGLVIVVDRADLLLEKNQNEFFDLIESFLLQFHHWYDQKKPCYLCFQMDKNDSIRRVFDDLGKTKASSPIDTKI